VVRANRWSERVLHLIDIENLAGTPLPAVGEVREKRVRYGDRVGIGRADLVVIACNHKALLSVALGWPGARYRVRSGPDGADLELIDVIDHEQVAERFARVVIGSGDGKFADSAVRLAELGCQVTIVSRRHSLARRLRLAASDLIYIDGPAAGRPASRSWTTANLSTAARSALASACDPKSASSQHNRGTTRQGTA
jgi:hypothetical protein